MAVALDMLVRLPRNASDAFARQMQNVSREMQAHLLREADRWSSGPYSSSTLRRMGHPYGIGRRPPAHPARINVQTGRFRAGWRLTVRREGEGLRFRLENSAPYAEFLFSGTRKMIPRPLPAVLAEFFERRLATVIRGTLRR